MKRMMIIGSVVFLVSIAAFMCSCANIETHRFAAINRAENSIYFQVSGFNSSPLTPEGPFPRWANDLKVTMEKGRGIPTMGNRQFSASTDFSARYNEVESGTMLVDQDKKRIDVNVKYVKSYWWNRAKGRFPITEDK